MSRLFSLGAALFLVPSPLAAAAGITPESVNAAQFEGDDLSIEGQSPLVLKVQILLDRANASPGVIDGYNGENVAKAIAAFETIHNLPEDGELDREVWAALGGDGSEPVLTDYTVTQEDLDQEFVGEISEDYAELAELERAGFASPEEMFAERFHMDRDLFKSLNAEADFQPGTKLIVANVQRPPLQASLSRLEADKAKGQLRGYDKEDKLVVAYPASIGSKQTPSPSGTHKVRTAAVDPIYYYQPDKNFQQGDNDEPLEIAPGPNNPVGTVWIDLSEPTYGIHGTPEPSKIDKTPSHGCVRLTNWDAEELVNLVQPGLEVEFVE
jgi:lipoprotein-anchoring transpeptidase ErfK/SrfK